ncbi:MAG TPA: HRDC domain-containing protein [Tepidisphaeraceae bacterium]|jgi:ribonuclease D
MGSSDPSKKHRHVSYRSAHRDRSHESAHAEEVAPPSGKQIDHPLVPKGPASLVTTEEQLGELIDHLRQAGRFGYDSEFIGELTYVPKLCLIQVASAERIALIDPLAGLDVTPFWKLVADPAIEKIVHAGQQDLEPIVRFLDRPPANIFDTQITAGFIGLPYPLSLSKLINETAGVKLGKGLTFTHWDQRPLSAMQLRYAADDVRYLVLARQKIGERLDELGHVNWAMAECAIQCEPRMFRVDPAQQYLRVRGSGSLPPRNLAVLRELAIWRDAVARQLDVPPRAFLKDEILLDLSRNPIKSVEKLDRVRGLPRPVEAEYGSQIVALTARALALPEADLPPAAHIEPSPRDKFRTDSLWAVAQCLCAGQSIDVAVATNRQEINEFYQSLCGKNDQNASDPHRLRIGWRSEALGRPLEQLLTAGSHIELSWPEDALEADSAE